MPDRYVIFGRSYKRRSQKLLHSHGVANEIIDILLLNPQVWHSGTVCLVGSRLWSISSSPVVLYLFLCLRTICVYWNPVLWKHRLNSPDCLAGSPAMQSSSAVHAECQTTGLLLTATLLVQRKYHGRNISRAVHCSEMHSIKQPTHRLATR